MISERPEPFVPHFNLDRTVCFLSLIQRVLDFDIDNILKLKEIPISHAENEADSLIRDLIPHSRHLKVQDREEEEKNDQTGLKNAKRFPRIRQSDIEERRYAGKDDLKKHCDNQKDFSHEHGASQPAVSPLHKTVSLSYVMFCVIWI